MVPFVQRRERLAHALREAQISAFLVARVVNVSYLTGFTGDSSYLLVTPDRTILISDDRYRIQIEAECPGLETYLRGHDRNTIQAIGAVVDQLGLTELVVEATGVTFADFERIKGECKATTLTGQAGFVEALRAIKDNSEVAAIRRSIHVAEQAFRALRATARPGDTEKEMADLLDGYIRRAGGVGLGFPPIVGVGNRSALPHCPVSDRRAAEAPFLLVDWGAQVGQYLSDLTRVIWSPGQKPSASVESELRKIYTVVHEAQARAIAAIRPGVSVKVVDKAARGYIAEQGYGDNFNHGLGHGFGLEIHESPQIRSNSEDVLQAGMVVTVEPGIYLPEFGGVRIEDDVWITPDGPQVLTTLPRDWDSL